jgi:hypothetical protein
MEVKVVPVFKQDNLNMYCNVFLLLTTQFRLLVGLCNNLQVVTTNTRTYNTVTGLQTLQTIYNSLFTLSSVGFTYL